MSAFNAIIKKAQASQKTILLPESDDVRVLEAATIAVAQKIAKPVLLGNQLEIETKAHSLGLSLNGIGIVDHTTHTKLDQYTKLLVQKREHRGMTPEKAELEVQNPLTFACLMISADDADACVAGAVTPTADVVRSAMQIIGKRESVTEVSSFFIMLLEEHHPVKDVIVIADCALVIDPNSETLASIAENTGESTLQLLGIEPQVAMLSFSTAGSAKHMHVSKVTQATELLQSQKPDWRIVGEVQLDAAVIPDILKKKAPEQASDEPCNVLIFPNLDAGNIGYKLIERFGGAQAIGPILQGLKKPINDLSRGCSTEDIVSLIATTAAQCSD